MRYCEMIGSHFGLEEVGLRDHSVDINLHDFFDKSLIIEASVVSILLEENSQLMLFKVATEFVKALFKCFEISIPCISQIEVRYGFLSCFPFVGLSIAF